MLILVLRYLWVWTIFPRIDQFSVFTDLRKNLIIVLLRQYFNHIREGFCWYSPEIHVVRDHNKVFVPASKDTFQILIFCVLVWQERITRQPRQEMSRMMARFMIFAMNNRKNTKNSRKFQNTMVVEWIHLYPVPTVPAPRTSPLCRISEV